MATYYLDPTLDFADATGANHTGNEYTGPGGFMAAKQGWGNATKLAAADILDIKAGTADLSKLVKITVNVDKTGTWVISDVVQNYNSASGDAGDDWVGELVHITATTLWVQINNASSDVDSVNTADGVDNPTQGEFIAGANMTAKSAPGIEFDGNENDGTTAGNVTIRGVKADWTVSTDPGNSLLYQAVWDGNSKAVNCWNFLDVVNRWRIENQTFQEATSHGFDCGNKSLGRWMLRHCLAKNNGARGFYLHAAYEFRLLLCIARDNGEHGFGGAFSRPLFVGDIAAGNTDYGFELYGLATYANCCLTYENGDDNFSLAGGAEYSFLMNCIGDGSTGGSGIKATDQDALLLLANRLTNNNQYGIEFIAADASAWADYNVIFNNGVGARLNVSAGPNDDDAPADDGYVNAAADDYNVKSGAEIRSTALVLNWDGV